MCSWHCRAAHLELDQAGESAQMKSQGCRTGAFALLLPPLGAWGQLLGLSLHDHDTNKQIQ